MRNHLLLLFKYRGLVRKGKKSKRRKWLNLRSVQPLPLTAVTSCD
uniref:Uncharacterized protein n=1 Tax=Mus musculus TaxID=10090 RepID=A0ABJ3HNU6_MOUSE